MKQVMNDTQVERFEMVCALLVLFGNNPEIVAALTALATAILQLTAEKDGISAVAIKRDEKKSSVKNVKSDSRSGLSHYTFKYSRKLRAIGRTGNIAELLNLESLPVSEAERTRFYNLGEYALKILDYMKKYSTDLADQKVTPEMITQFETMTLEYVATLSRTDATFSESVGETEDLEVKFTSMMSKVYLIDDIIDGIRDEYPEFCSAYDATRIIHNYGLRHKTPEELEILKAKAAELKAKRALARKEKAAKAKAEKIQKLRQKNNIPGNDQQAKTESSNTTDNL